MAIIFWAGLAAGVTIINEDVNLLNLAAACFSAALLGITCGAISLTIGCAAGKRNMATAVASGLPAITYLLNALASVIDMLQPFRSLRLQESYNGPQG